MDLINKTIVLGITGGVAAFKACELVRLLTAQGANRSEERRVGKEC